MTRSRQSGREAVALSFNRRLEANAIREHTVEDRARVRCVRRQEVVPAVEESRQLPSEIGGAEHGRA